MITVRPIATAQEGALALISFWKSFNEEVADSWTPDIPVKVDAANKVSEKNLMPALAKGDPILLAEFHGVVVGCVFCVSRSHDLAEIKALWVHKDHRAEGIADRLLAEAKEVLLKKNAKILRVNCPAGHEIAKKFFKARGFKLRDVVIECKLS